jgi:hypothetical protein
MAADNCKACKHFQDHGQMGVCRRYPTYQNRHHSEICGEFFALPVEILVLPVKEMTEEPVKRQRGRPKK